MLDKTGADAETKDDLNAGIEAANRVLTQANAAVDRELRNEAFEDLISRVDDWKSHRADQFGDLLLHGHFPVVTGKSDVQKEVRARFLLVRTPTMRKLRAVGYKCKALVPTGSKPDSSVANKMERESLVSSCSPEARIPTGKRQRDGIGDLQSFFANKLFLHFTGFHPVTGDPFLVTQFANELGIICPRYEQYTIYLFEKILLCCKESNPNKSKDKLMGTKKDAKDKKDRNKGPDKNAKLHLKGRIFMTNVTEVVSLAKKEQGAYFELLVRVCKTSLTDLIGSYTVQIYWKGDPGVENFIVKFSNEETMKKWSMGVDAQRREYASSAQSGISPDGPPTDFAWMQHQKEPILNPYAQEEEEDDDDVYSPPSATPNSTYSGPAQGMPRNPSSTSLRSRSATGESAHSLARGPPSRYPMNSMSVQTPPTPLSLQTQMSAHLPSPSQRLGDSYFSPVAESPASSRTSTTSGMFPFPRQGQGIPQSGWEPPDYSGRYTAPAMPRAPSRGSQTPIDPYGMNRQPQRPSLPAMPQSSQTGAANQRSRSYSTPDINAQTGGRRLPNGQANTQVPAVPGIPAHLHPAYDSGIPRSQNNSPSGMPIIRSNTQSPGVQRERMMQQPSYPAAQYARSNTSQIPINQVDSRTMTPPINNVMSGMTVDSDLDLPTQLKVKVNCDGNYVTLVVAFNITYQSLIDRIDAKVGRFSNNAIARGTMRLRYRDEDGDFVTIESDDDIQIAFQEWREAQKQQYHNGQLGEIELFCLSVTVDN